MIRETLALQLQVRHDQLHARGLAVRLSHHQRWHRRLRIGKPSLAQLDRLSRSGNTITLFQSTDGITFNLAGTVNLSALASQVYIGLVTNSHDIKELDTATFTDVAITGSLGAAQATFNSLPRLQILPQCRWRHNPRRSR